ncbi:hypothetical protein [Limnochorda pilosa]|nr:hypothetical protein [Limnochorda pilosa]
MAFLREIGFLDYLERLRPSRRERFMVRASLILLTYMIKTLPGIEHLHAMPALLSSDPTIMKLLGFSARWLEEGLCRRSEEKRGEGKEPPKPFSAQMVANFPADLILREAAAFFNQAIQ